jgi:hypothetical protein
MNEILPKPPRKMLQPTKDELRRRIAIRDEELERLRALLDRLTPPRPWWRRIFRGTN